MDPPLLETRRVDYTSGNDPAKRFESFAASHPFTRQVDVVFPASGLGSTQLEQKLSQLSTTYGTGWVRLSDLVNNLDVSTTSSNPNPTANRNVGIPQIVSISSRSHAHGGHDDDNDDEDIWCIDHRGVLTMYLSKGSYERLGLVGRKIPKGWKRDGECHVVQLPLHKNAESAANRAKRDSALKVWDEWREQNGLGPWRVGYCSEWMRSPGEEASRHPQKFENVGGRVDQVKEIRGVVRRMTDIHVPVISIPPQPKGKKKQKGGKGTEEEEEDWFRYVESIFEWVGMGCLGAQRLQGNDRVDSYIAVYEPPEPSIIGNLTHLKWTGLMRPEFVQLILDIIFGCLKEKTDTQEAPSFVAVTCSALTASPVSYIPPASLVLLPEAGRVAVVTTPIRVPRSTAEDTFSIIGTPMQGDENGRWVMGESIGRFDSRRG